MVNFKKILIVILPLLCSGCLYPYEYQVKNEQPVHYHYYPILETDSVDIYCGYTELIAWKRKIKEAYIEMIVNNNTKSNLTLEIDSTFLVKIGDVSFDNWQRKKVSLSYITLERGLRNISLVHRGKKLKAIRIKGNKVILPSFRVKTNNAIEQTKSLTFTPPDYLQ